MEGEARGIFYVHVVAPKHSLYSSWLGGSCHISSSTLAECLNNIVDIDSMLSHVLEFVSESFLSWHSL